VRIMKKETLTLECPKCQLPAKAFLDSPYHKFIMYTCPRCHSNVVYYKDRVDTLSDRLFKKLLKKHKLEFCGQIDFISPVKGKKRVLVRGPITHDDILNLKILLETEKNTSDFISKI